MTFKTADFLNKPDLFLRPNQNPAVYKKKRVKINKNRSLKG